LRIQWHTRSKSNARAKAGAHSPTLNILPAIAKRCKWVLMACAMSFASIIAAGQRSGGSYAFI